MADEISIKDLRAERKRESAMQHGKHSGTWYYSLLGSKRVRER